MLTQNCEQTTLFVPPSLSADLPLVRLSELSRTLAEIRVKPVKTLGQNFLHDQNLARWIVRQAEISAGDFVVEIGPGLGAITGPALDAGAHILAIEKDGRLTSFLREEFGDQRLEVLHQDALNFDVRTLFPRGNVKLIGNLPYYAATELLSHFLRNPSPISSAVLMLQREVGARLSAAPHSKEYGVLTLLVQAQWRVEFLRTISPSVFLPKPDVSSALVRLTPRKPDELPEHDSETLRTLVRLGFSQRRKQVAKLLRNFVPDWNAAAHTLGATPQARAEELSLEQWIALARLVTPIDRENSANDPQEIFTVVDENDRVIDARPRAEVHGNNLRHRAAHIFVFNAAGELLLQKRSPRKDRHPDVWDSSAAGHVSAGETYDATARRELREELGIETELNRVAKIPASDRTGEEFIWLYRASWDGKLQPNRAEISAVEFFPLQLVSDWLESRPADFAPGFIECWRAFSALDERLA